MLKVNVLGTLAVTQAMLPLIRKGGKKVVRSLLFRHTVCCAVPLQSSVKTVITA